MNQIPPAPASQQPSTSRHMGLGAFVIGVTATAALALAIAAVPVFVLKPAGPSTTPVPGVVVSHGPLRFVPDPGPSRRAAATEISQFLRGLYEATFIAAREPDPPSPSPSPAPAVRLARFFSTRARATVAAHPDVFTPGSAVLIHNGRVTFDGLVTMSRRRPAQAFLDVLFTGIGETKGTPVVVTQKGSVLLVHSEQGWAVGGFDLRLNEMSVTPSPSPTPR